MFSVLCIDEEPDTHDYFNLILPANCRLASIRRQADLEEVKNMQPDLVFIDIDFGKGLGRKFLGNLRYWLRTVPIIVHTHTVSVGDVVRSMRDGAADFVAKPISRQCLLSKLGSLRRAGADRHAFRGELDLALGFGKVAQRYRELAAAFVKPRDCCFLWGETGTGKYVVARHLHGVFFAGSGLPSGTGLRDRFLAWSPKGRSAEQQEADLFGVRAGSANRGLLERLEGGTLLIEDLDCLDAGMQLRLARLLVHGTGRLGVGTQVLPAHFRLIASSSLSPSSLRRNGRLVDELARILLPGRLQLVPLRERGDDLAGLAWYHLENAARNLPEVACRWISHAALEKLAEYPWPGNLPELRQCITEACLHCRSEDLQPEDLVFPPWPI